MHAPVLWPPPSLKTRRIRRNHPQRKGGSSKKGDEIFSLWGSSKMHFATSSSRWREPCQMTLSIQKFQDPASCLTYVWTSCVISVWILSESSSEFLFEFLSEICLSFCLNFVWNLSEFCLNYCVWIWSEFSIFPLFYRVSIDSDMSEVCWKLSEFCSESCRNFGLNVVWILVWILSEFLSEIVWMSEFCLNYIWVLGPFGGQRNMSMRVVKRKQLRKENQFWETNFCNRSISPMAMQKKTPGQERSSGIFSRTGAAKKLKNPLTAGLAQKGPIQLFLGPNLDL